MGERSINTILRLQNEAEYRAALKNCNSELKNLKSQLDLTSSEFRNNANSMEALTAKGNVLSDMYDAQQRKLATLRGALEQAEQTRDKEMQTVNELRARYEEAKKALDAYGDEVDESSEDYQKAKAEVDDLTNSLYLHQVKLDSAEAAVNKYSSQINRATIELNNLEDRQEENNRLLEEAKNSADGCATSIDKYGDAVKKAAEGTEQSVSAVDALSSALVAGGVQQKVEDLAATMMECAEASQSFELAIAKVYTLADESVLSQDAMRAGILEMSSELGKSADEIGEAVYQALSAGVDTANVLSFVRQSTQLSVAGFTDAANAVDVLTTILNAYGLEASQTETIASKLVKTQDLGKITVDDLGKVLGRIIPTAAAYGVNLDNIAAAYANMTASGINAENTTTYLSTMLDELSDSGSDVAVVLKQKTGKSFAELMDSGKSLGDVLDILGDSVDGDTVQFSNLWSSATAGKAAIALFNSGAEKFNTTLKTMSSSSGAVAANYKALADTSDYATRRMDVAAENLKVAVGDQLNPVLDKLRNAAAGIMETAADIVSNNPTLVAAITGVVTVVGLLATGLSALMIAKSVAAAMEALNIAMAANPAVLIAAAIAGLGVAIATLVSQSDEANERLNALTESSRAFADTVAAGNQTYADSVASAEAAYATVDGYIDRLAELEKQGELTEEQQREYSVILDQINATIPELNASLDSQTRLLEGGTEALRSQAEQWKQNAVQEAIYARYKDDVAAMADAQYELTKNEILRASAQEELTAASSRLAEYQDRLLYYMLALSSAAMDDAETIAQFNARMEILRNNVSVYSIAVDQQTVAEREARAAVEEYDEAIRICNETISENASFVDVATEAYNSFAEQTEETRNTVTAEAAAIADSTSEAFDKVSEEYKSLYDAARASLDAQIGLFEKVSLKCDQSTADMIDALRSQQKAFEDYADNLTLAMERGIDKGLVQQLSDGSAESMAILAELVTASDEQIAELNAAFFGVSEAKDTVVGAMADVEYEMLSALDSAKASLYSGGVSAGGSLVDGLIAGIRAKAPIYEQAVGSLANSGINQYKQVNLIKSPSKRWAKLAEWDVTGITSTYQKSVPKIESSSAQMANAGYAAAIRSRQRSMLSLSSSASMTPTSGASASILPVLSQILAAIKDGQIIALDGRALVGSTGKQRDQYMGQQIFLTERGAK